MVHSLRYGNSDRATAPSAFACRETALGRFHDKQFAKICSASRPGREHASQWNAGVILNGNSMAA